MKIDSVTTYIGRKEDRPYLRERLLPVSMRLFESSPQYKKIILECCKYLEYLALSEYEDYTKPFGISGANAGIPFNIIGIVVQRNTPNAHLSILINPKIVETGVHTEIKDSNCGSIRLKNKIKVRRHKKILVEFYDIEGRKGKLWFQASAATIQHEIDHNNGILITDREEII